MLLLMLVLQLEENECILTLSGFEYDLFLGVIFTIRIHFVLSPICRLRSFFLTDRSYKHLIERTMLQIPKWFWWAHKGNCKI